MDSLITQKRSFPLIQEIDSSETEIEQPKKAKLKKCIVCRKKCNYECPKCKKNYCSVGHYRSHNLFCTEQFYQKQVQQSLKGMKVRDKKEKQKTIQMIKHHQTLMAQETIQGGISETRLLQMLQALEEGSEITLSEFEQKLFEQYVDDRNVESTKQFWQIQDGLSLYILKQPEIEEWNESQHSDLILFRYSQSQRLRDFKNNHQQPLIANPLIRYHIYQVVYLGTLLYRIYDGQAHSQFMNILLKAYFTKYNSQLLQLKQGLSRQVMIKSINQSLKEIGRHSDKGLQTIIGNWIGSANQIIILDCEKVFKNKYLLVEMMFRLIDCLKQGKGINNIKLTKKLEFLIHYIVSNYECMINSIQKDQE